jgi:peptide/nickel transport system substrate-binding protein
MPCLVLLLCGCAVLSAQFPAAEASTRPRYGGTIRVRMQAAIRSLAPGEQPSSPSEQTAKNRVISSIFEGLTRLGRDGNAQPCLATSWRQERDSTRWVFALRAGVKLHGGTPLSPTAVSDGLNATLKGMRARASGDSVIIQSEQPVPDLPRRLAQPQYSVLLRASDGKPAGTGPFRIVEWQPGQNLKLAAHEDHWAGRPFVDFVEIELGRALRDQLVDLELGKADLVELAPNQVRGAGQRGILAIATQPFELWALVFKRDSPPAQAERTRQALALSIDRFSAHTVLLQKRGEVSGALLPQWLSGYAFLFPTARDVTQAKARLSGPPAVPLSFGYEARDAVERNIAERIAVNAHEAGLVLKAVTDPVMMKSADVRLRRAPLVSRNAGDALAGLARELGMPSVEVSGGPPEQLYEAEQALLKFSWVVPLFHLPSNYGLGPALKAAAARILSTNNALECEFPPLEQLWLSPPVSRGAP